MTPHLHEEQGCSLNTTQATAACEGASSSLIVPVFTLSGLDSYPPPALRSFRRLAAVVPAPVITTQTHYRSLTRICWWERWCRSCSYGSSTTQTPLRCPASISELLNTNQLTRGCRFTLVSPAYSADGRFKLLHDVYQSKTRSTSRTSPPARERSHERTPSPGDCASFGFQLESSSRPKAPLAAALAGFRW